MPSARPGMGPAENNVLFPQHRVSVLVTVAVGQPYTYLHGGQAVLEPGTFVRVPLGPREVLGVVWPGEAPQPGPATRLREIVRVYDAPPLSPAMLDFVGRLARYTFSPLGMVLRMVLRGEEPLLAERPLTGLRLAGPPPKRMTPARSRVLETLGERTWLKTELAATAGVGPGVIDGLVKAGTLVAEPVRPPPTAPTPDPERPGAELSKAQAEAARALVRRVEEGGFAVSLLDGVTGSGKTEVYFEAVAAALRRGDQVLILMPEIALTSAFLARFEERFGVPPAAWHSDVTAARKTSLWRAASRGEIAVVAGARSALFLPFRSLGLVVVDEEHDQAYKQGDRVIYNARDMAVLRAQCENAPVVLASATPSVESWVNADRGRYERLVLPRRFSEADPPVPEVIDMRTDGPEPGRWLAPRLADAIRSTAEAGAQSLLFLNRRGYAPLTLCRACGHRFSCPNCSAWLVEHRFKSSLSCHHCGHAERRPKACPVCRAEDSLVACGPGVERLAEEVVERFPHLRTIVLSSDMAGGVQRLRAELEAIAKGEVDVIIGTQLVSKGHNFPRLSLVGVVDADLGLSTADPRAAERTFQLLTQVTGRAGRAGQASSALLQTYAPDHPVIAALLAQDRENFYRTEIETRRAGRLPPFGRLTAIIVSANDRPGAEWYAREMARAAPEMEGVRLLGPVEAPLAVVRGRHRQRLLVQAASLSGLQTYLRRWLADAPEPRGSVRVMIDVDPQSFL